LDGTERKNHAEPDNRKKTLTGAEQKVYDDDDDHDNDDNDDNDDDADDAAANDD